MSVHDPPVSTVPRKKLMREEAGLRAQCGTLCGITSSTEALWRRWLSIVTSATEHCDVSDWALWRLTSLIDHCGVHCGVLVWVLWCQWLSIVMSVTEHCDDWHQWLTIVISVTEHCDFSDWALWRHASQIEHCDVSSWALWRQWLTLWCQWLNILTSVIEHCRINDWTLWRCHWLSIVASVIWTLWRQWIRHVCSCERRAWWAGRAHCAQPMRCRGAQDVRVYQYSRMAAVQTEKEWRTVSEKNPFTFKIAVCFKWRCWWRVYTDLFVYCCYDVPMSSSLSLFS